MFYIQIMQRGAGEGSDTCVKQMEDASKNGADRIKRGAEINLNHDDYYVQVSETSLTVVER